MMNLWPNILTWFLVSCRRLAYFSMRLAILQNPEKRRFTTVITGLIKITWDWDRLPTLFGGQKMQQNAGVIRPISNSICMSRAVTLLKIKIFWILPLLLKSEFSWPFALFPDWILKLCKTYTNTL